MTEWHVFPTADDLGNAAAELIAKKSQAATAQHGRFTVAISGGSLLKLISPILETPYREQVAWDKWHVFWADERCVLLTDPDSNFRLATETLLSHVDIPPTQIYPLDDLLDAGAAAIDYERKLQQVFGETLPAFDLILLGMGPDGHTASLFPNHELLNEREKWVAPIFNSPKPPPERITLTLPVINNARCVAFIAAGASKAQALSRLRDLDRPSYELPASMVQPVGELHWFIDEAAIDLPTEENDLPPAIT